jgi:apolipoprotein N-acyltransferase
MKSNRQSYLLLAIGAFLMLSQMAAGSFLMRRGFRPFSFLRFMRLQKPLRGFLYVALAMSMVNMTIWWKIIPAPPGVYFFTTGLMMQTFALCFLGDRLLATRMKGIPSTLVFPVMWCSIEYLSSLNPAKASWTSLAYTQAGDLPLMQLTAITGIWGVSFLITWFASIVNWVWEQNFEWKKFRKEAIIFTSIAGAIFLFGTIRINLPDSLTRSIAQLQIDQPGNITEDLRTCIWTDARGLNEYQQ